MALSSRELYLVLRARDEATRAIDQVGRSLRTLGNQAATASLQAARAQEQQNLAIARYNGASAAQVRAIRSTIAGYDQQIAAARRVQQAEEDRIRRLHNAGQAAETMGVMTAAAGTAVLAGFYKATQAAVTYEKQVAATKTQVREVGVTMEQLSEIGLNVARTFGVPFESIQEGLREIFSSTDVSVKEAEYMIAQFSKAAIAGNTDLLTVTRITTGQMNAFGIEAKDVTRVLDVQFKLVQLGVGTYKEIATQIGRVSPSAVRAGQDIETLSGMMAFLTRNGLTVSQAATSSARALDLLANPKVSQRLEDMGVKVFDAQGKFRPFADIVVDLQKKFEGLTKQELIDKLSTLFKGGGNDVAARRFFDIALGSKEAATQVKSLIDQMGQGGATQEKYNEMANTMAVRQEHLKNQFQVLKIEIGQQFMPILEKVTDLLMKAMRWFDGLSDSSQRSIVMWVAIGAAVAVVGGTLAAATGAMMVLAAALGLTVGVLGAIVIAVGAFIAIWVTAYNKVDWFQAAVNAWFGLLKNAAMALWDGMKVAFEGIKAAIDAAWRVIQNIVNLWKAAFDQTLGPLMKTFLESVIKPVWQGIQNAIQTAWNFIKPIWDAIYAFIKNNLGPVVEWLANTIFKPMWGVITTAVQVAWAILQVIFGMIQVAIKAVAAVLEWLWNTVWKPIWTFIGDAIQAAWNTRIKPIVDVLKSAIEALKPVFESFAIAAKAAWDKVAEVAKVPIRFVVNTVLNDGLLKAYNAIAGAFNVKPDNVHVAANFATGGKVGEGKSLVDDVPAMLRRGEHVWTPEEVDKAGGHGAMYRMRAAVMEGRAKFARGGEVTNNAKKSWMGDGPFDWITGLVGGLNPLAAAGLDAAASNPAVVLNKFLGLLDGAGKGGFAETAKAGGKKVIEGVIKWIGEKIGFGSGDAGSGKFNAQPNGWPPHLGNQPPWSPNVAAAAGFIRAMNPGMAVGSYVSGMGWSDHFPKAIDNMTSAHDPNGLKRGNGIAKWFIEHPAAYGTKYVIWNKRITTGQGWGPYSVPGQGDHSDHVHLSFYKAGGAVRKAARLMDNGGYLNEGMNMVYNATGQKERVLDAAETRAYESGKRGSSGAPIIINVYTQEINPRYHAEMLGQELDRRMS